jgi:hypothetical protein
VSADGFLLLAFGDNAWGRAALARAIGEDLRAQGRSVGVIAGKAGAGAFAGSGLAVEVLPDLPKVLLKLYLEDVLARSAPAAILLCDGESVLHAFDRLNLDPGLLAKTGARVFAVDTWNLSESGLEADAAGGTQPLQPWPDWLEPVRLAPLSRLGGEGVCSGLFPSPAAPRRATGRRVVMLSTSPWQHGRPSGEREAATRREVPALLAEAIAQVEGLELVHVGPEPLPGFEPLGSRYRHLSALPPADYLRLMAESAVYLSLSPVCAAQVKALGLGIPVLLVQHAEPGAALERLPYPFRVWPLGYARFLEPVLKDNPLLEAVTTVELSRPRELVRALRSLSLEGPARERALARQASYVESVMALPRPASYIAERCEGVCS